MVKRLNPVFYKPYMLMITLSLTIAILSALYFATPVFKQKLEDELSKLVIDEVTTIVDNTKNLIIKKINKQDIVKTLLENEALRKDIEDILSILITQNIRYAYIVFKDKDGKFRFIADGSKENKARPGQKFDVFNPKWEEVFSNKDVLIKQSKLATLWITYLSPIVQNGKVKAILAVDFSVSKLKQINSLIENIKLFLSVFIFFSLGLLIFVAYQFYRYTVLRKRTFIDPLTGVNNRNYLNDISPYIDLNTYAVALLDLDNFKTINDTYGHDVGDIILKSVAKKIKEIMKNTSNIIIRYGGEEFLLFINKEEHDPVKILEKIRSSIGNHPIKINDKEKLRVTVSIGVYVETEKARSLEQAIKAADIALYKAKKDGKNKLIVYTEEFTDGLYSINDIKEALEENRIFCEYQPIVDLDTGEILHYEALVRLKDGNGKTIYPNQFLFEIKGTLLYAQLTQKVLEINFKLLEEDREFRVAVNLSAEDIVNQAVIDILKNKAQKNKELVSRMVLEILETEEITNYNLFKDFIKELKNLGYKIAIDDFGTGYSNFTQLINLNVNYLKIDASLIKDILKDNTVYMTVKTIQRFANDIGAEAIAEHISDENIYYTVKNIGIKYGQGFYIAKPMPYEKVKQFEINRNRY